MKFLYPILLCAMSALAADPTMPDEPLKNTIAEIGKLTEALELQNDSLHALTAQRYSLRQKAVEQREIDKRDFDRSDEQLSRLQDELSRVKEERFSREQQLADEQQNLKLKQDEWAFLRTHISEILQKEADKIAEAFPLDKEKRRAELEKVRSMIDDGQMAGALFPGFIDYHLNWMRKSDTAVLERAVVAPSEGAPVALVVARLGSVAGFGLDTATGSCYYLRQTGRLGNDKFTVDKIGAPLFAESVREGITRWMTLGRISGPVPFDMMQNDQSRLIITGKEQKPIRALYESFAKGGLIMVPLLLLPLWVLALSLSKLIQFGLFGSRMKAIIKESSSNRSSNNNQSASSAAKKYDTHVMAEIAGVCVRQASSGRISAERKIDELRSVHAPVLSRNLNTLAVIAGAAPLLGLLGTISGMITLFAAVTHYGTGDPKFLAGGISEALITAKTGLAIAIPVLFIHDFLRGMRDNLLNALEKGSITLLDVHFPEE